MAPARLQQLLEEAVAHHGAGRLDQAEKIYRQARAAGPAHFDVLHLSGTLALQQGRHGEAAELLGAALPLNPRSAVCAMRLALALAGLGRLPEAESHLRLALRRQPDLPEAWDHLGSVLKAQGRLTEAIPCHERAVARKPDFISAWHNLGLVLHYAGRLTESLAAHDRALALAPQQARLHYGRAITLQQAHRLDEAIVAYEAALTRDPGHALARSYRLLALNYGSRCSREELFAEHRAYGAALPAADHSVVPDGAGERRLRVAFLSPDLRTHSVAYFLEPLLAHLDRTAFEVLLYHDHFSVDETSRRLEANASVWRNFSGLPPEAVEAAIRADAPDILVDLAGHTGMNRLPLLARRVAPVQVAYLGYPNTTGVPAMDFRLTDETADPLGVTDAWHTERLLRFAPTAWAYQPPLVAPAPAARPPCAANGYVTFGCFNNFSKVSDETIAAWATLLGAVPHSRLRLKISGLAEAAVGDRARERLRRLDLADERLELSDRTPGLAAHLAQYHEVDVALDPFPYHGTTTTCEALWMGVPVVTLAGGHHAARVGASLLTALGHRDWIARDWNGYAHVAAGLAEDPERLAALRAGLRDEMKRSPLLDHAGQAARFGAALQECWSARAGRSVPSLAFA
jgi:predicted O-linked N-acetylglucosamine transferase (SPINDLY family)